MAKIQNETAYRAAMERIEELLPLTDVKFTIKTVLIRFIGTHAEYDLIDAKNI